MTLEANLRAFGGTSSAVLVNRPMIIPCPSLRVKVLDPVCPELKSTVNTIFLTAPIIIFV